MALHADNDSSVDISIIVPMHNSAKTIKECLKSILDSEFEGKREIIVVDDGSKDNSIELIKDLPVKIISQENRGAASAKNQGAKYASGEFIVFVDSDVIFSQDTLKKIHDIIKNEQYHYVATRYSEYPANSAYIHKYKALHDYYFFYHMFYSKSNSDDLEYAPIPLNGGVEAFKKKTFLEFGGYDETIKGAGVEREELFTRLRQKYHYVWNSGVILKHYFPDFRPLTRNYFYRAQGTLQLIKQRNYFPENFNKLKNRMIIAPITVISFFFSTLITIFFYSLVGYFLFTIPAIFCIYYVVINRGFFSMAFQKHGFFFMMYTLIIHGFFSNVAALSGFLTMIKGNKPGKP
nr:glycosyltransferase family 2 protein [Candidatus Sigynarchaeota archaeon]